MSAGAVAPEVLEHSELDNPQICTALKPTGERCQDVAKWESIIECAQHPNSCVRYWCNGHKTLFVDSGEKFLCLCCNIVHTFDIISIWKI